MGGVPYTKFAAIDILNTPPRGDATYILAHALIAAKLNAELGFSYGTLISEADAFLTSNPLGSDPRGTDRDDCISLAEQLDALNNS